MQQEPLKSFSFVVDIDGTLCPIKTKEQQYEDLKPYPQMVDKLREYKDQGARIVLFTARNMNSYGGNLGQINVHTAKVLLAWLDKWNIPYDEILYGKPWPGHHGFYVDDRSVRPDEFLKYDLDQLHQICEAGRKELET